MSQIEHLVLVIEHVLQANDPVARKEAQATLLTLRNEKPSALMTAYLQVILGAYKLQHRNFAVSQLRLCLSDFAPATYTNCWGKLEAEVQEGIKNGLFNIIEVEPDLSMKKHIADTIGEVAGSIIARKQSWIEFKGLVWKLFSSNDSGSNLAGFYILESFLPFAPEYFKENTSDLYTLFQTALQTQNSKLQLSALRCFVSYLQVLEPKAQSSFQLLIPSILGAVQGLLFRDSNQEGLEALSEMLDVEPRFFKKSFEALITGITAIFNHKGVEPGVKRMATEILVDYAEKSPVLFRKKAGVLQQVIEMVFFHMVEISSEIQDSWLSPEEGYNEDLEDDDDFETTRFGMGAIDRLIYTIGDEELLPILSATIEKLLAENDWRYKYTAVMALSQIGEYIEDVEKISSVLAMITGFLKHENPMMRYASCHAIGQISDDMQPRFQEKYGLALLPQLIALLNDPVPRVVSHSAAALTNFLEGFKIEQLSSSLPTIVGLLLNHTISGISLVKESCLSALSSTVQIAKELYAPYLVNTMDVLFEFFKSEKYTGREYKQLKGQCVQTLTIIASSVGISLFAPYGPVLIELLITLQGSEFEQTDPQKTYILAGWQRLCLVYGRELEGQLGRILPSLFALVKRVVNDELAAVSSEPIEQKETKDGNVNTYETEEAEVAISMLNVFIEQLKELYSPWVAETVTLLIQIIKEHPNEDVKEEACKCLPNLITAIKDTRPHDGVHLAKIFLGTLVETIEKEFDSSIVIVELETLKSILENLNISFLTQEQVGTFSQKILQLLRNSDQKKQSSLGIGDEEIDEEEKQIIGEEIKQEEEVQVAISELIGALFKTHKAHTIGLADYLIKEILPKVFVPNQTQNMLKFGIFLIDDMVEFLGYESLSAHWESFYKVLVRFITEKSCVIRQAACYGLGIYAENTPNVVVEKEKAEEWLGLLLEAIKIPKGTEKEKTYGHCRDNGVASVGKIIKAHGNKFNAQVYVQLWMKFLPLKFDKDEGMTQNELLLDIMENQASLALGSNPLQGLRKVLSIYADIVGNKKLYNDSIAQKIRKQILGLQSQPLYKESIGQIWQTLSDKQRDNFNTFMK